MAGSDRVKAGIYTSSNAFANQLSISGRLNDIDGNKISITLRNAIVTGIEIIDINKDF